MPAKRPAFTVGNQETPDFYAAANHCPMKSSPSSIALREISLKMSSIPN